MQSLPDPGTWNGHGGGDNDDDGGGHQQQDQYQDREGEYHDDEHGGYNDDHGGYNDGGYQDDDGHYRDEEQAAGGGGDGQYQYDEHDQQYEQHDAYDDGEAIPRTQEPQPQQQQQKGVRFRSVLQSAKQSSARKISKGRKQISAYNLFGLSRVSAEYDTGRKGYLTAAEQKLRELDKADAGTLSNAQVAQLMEQKLREDEIIRRQRRLIWVLGGMTLLLMLSNLGTAWAAAILAKDTAVDLASGELRVAKQSGNGGGEGAGSEVVVTRAMGDSFMFHNANASSTVLMNHRLEEEEEEEDGEEDGAEDSDATATAGSTASIANAEGGASTNDMLVPGQDGFEEAEEDDEEEEDDDDSLFCISPARAAKLWHETSTGTPVTAFFDYSPPASAGSATAASSVAPEVHSLTLNADGAMMNATHACLHTGISPGSPGPQYVCIDFANTKCDAEAARAAAATSGAASASASTSTALSGANDGTSTDPRASTNPSIFQGGDDDSHHAGEEDHVHGRRLLFETALQRLRAPHSTQEGAPARGPMARPQNNLRGGNEAERASAASQGGNTDDAAIHSSALTRRTRRKKRKNQNNPNPNKKKNRRKNNTTKRMYGIEVSVDMCILIPMVTDITIGPSFPGGPQQLPPASSSEAFGDFIAPYDGKEEDNS